jgi:chromate reductase, NAD(P)H dehydrogenase (quinone)
MNTPLHILAFAGSLRRASFNRGLLRAATTVLPEGMTLEIYDLAPIPLYNRDVEGEAFPEIVKDFKERIKAADGLLIATPEYNHGMPGVLKNALDWATRPSRDSALNGKPLAILGAGGAVGTARAQQALRLTASACGMLTMNHPIVLAHHAVEKFDAQTGDLTDEPTRLQVKALLEAFGEWIRRVR